MTRYETLKHKPKRFLSLTGYTLEEFSALVAYFSKRFLASVETKTLQGKHRKKRRYTQYKNMVNSENKFTFQQKRNLPLRWRGFLTSPTRV